MRFIGIIPARYASTRFPGKPLAMIGGKPMIQRVYEQAKKVLDTVIVATDDNRIFACVESFGGKAVMTSADHPCGTNRCYEAYEKWCGDAHADDVIINIQGDEPFIQPDQIQALISCFNSADTQIATLVRPYHAEDTVEALLNPNTPKVLVSNGYALYFSRSVIPYLRGVEQERWIRHAEACGHPYYRHIGMYAYKAEVLSRIVEMPQSALEISESLEQLRWLEAGIPIRVNSTETQSIGIDTPDDLVAAEAFLRTLQA